MSEKNKNRLKNQRKKALKRQKLLTERRKEHSNVNKNAIAIRAVEKTLDYPIKDCCITEELLLTGVGFVIFSRQLEDNQVALSLFQMFLDQHGVQEALFLKLPTERYEDLIKKVRGHFYKIFGKRVKLLNYNNGLVKLEMKTPEYIKKLILGAVEYAKLQGNKPHKDYEIAITALNPYDTSIINETFDYGHYRDSFLKNQEEFEKNEQAKLDQIKSEAIPQLRQHFTAWFKKHG